MIQSLMNKYKSMKREIDRVSMVKDNNSSSRKSKEKKKTMMQKKEKKRWWEKKERWWWEIKRTKKSSVLRMSLMRFREVNNMMEVRANSRMSYLIKWICMRSLSRVSSWNRGNFQIISEWDHTWPKLISLFRFHKSHVLKWLKKLISRVYVLSKMLQMKWLRKINLSNLPKIDIMNLFISLGLKALKK